MIHPPNNIIYLQEKTIEEHNKSVKRIVSKDKKRREMLKKAGIEYEFPEFVSILYFPGMKIYIGGGF